MTCSSVTRTARISAKACVTHLYDESA
jgi:hypothetical protein